MDPLHLRVYVWMFFTNLVSQKNATIPDVNLEFSDNVLGTLNVNNILITGLETIVNNINNINTTGDDDGNNYLCVYMPIGNLQITLDYEADIGIDDEIPIYGNGIFSFPMTDIEFDICLFINFNEGYIDVINFFIKYHHQLLQFTGFWRNDEVSLILENLLNIFNRFFAMWTAYEPERASCLTTPFVSYILNHWFGNVNYTFAFDTTCLKKIFLEDTEYNVSEDIEEYILNKIMKDTGTDGTEDALSVFAAENKTDILPIIKYLTQIGAKFG